MLLNAIKELTLCLPSPYGIVVIILIDQRKLDIQSNTMELYCLEGSELCRHLLSILSWLQSCRPQNIVDYLRVKNYCFTSCLGRPNVLMTTLIICGQRCLHNKFIRLTKCVGNKPINVVHVLVTMTYLGIHSLSARTNQGDMDSVMFSISMAPRCKVIKTTNKRIFILIYKIKLSLLRFHGDGIKIFILRLRWCSVRPTVFSYPKRESLICVDHRKVNYS